MNRQYKSINNLSVINIKEAHGPQHLPVRSITCNGEIVKIC